jgi:hypothetical protein
MIQVYRGFIATHNFESSCKEALAEATTYNGVFCHGSIMTNHTGHRLRDYTFNTSCKDALPAMSRSVIF